MTSVCILAECYATSDCGDLEICDTGVGQCVAVQCVDDGDCMTSMAGPRCVAGNVCGCSGNTDCMGNVAGLECLPGNVCGCGASDDCMGDRVCNTMLGECIDAECYADVDCAGLAVCDTNMGECVPVECLVDGNCLNDPKGANCLASNVCGCAAPSDCTGNAVGAACVGAVCGCATSNDCGTGRVCDTDANECIVAGCFSDDDCTDPQVCDTGLGACVTVECLADSDCMGNVAGPSCLANNECGCDAAAECSGNAVGQACLGSQVCGCTTSNDCGTDRVCNTNTNQCIVADCYVDVDCSGPAVCDTNAGECVECTTDSHCTGNLAGPSCLATKQCGCELATDCAGNPNGTMCRPTVNVCGCTGVGNCAMGQVCNSESICEDSG
jgi:hypothetical protein